MYYYQQCRLNKGWYNAFGDEEVVCLGCSFGGRKSREVELLNWDITLRTGEHPEVTQAVIIFYLRHSDGILLCFVRQHFVFLA